MLFKPKMDDKLPPNPPQYLMQNILFISKMGDKLPLPQYPMQHILFIPKMGDKLPPPSTQCRICYSHLKWVIHCLQELHELLFFILNMGDKLPLEPADPFISSG